MFEAGHGKGAADAVGGTVKRRADELVNLGTAIPSATDLLLVLQPLTKIKMFLITQEDVLRMEALLPTGVQPLKGTMQIHQLQVSNHAGSRPSSGTPA